MVGLALVLAGCGGASQAEQPAGAPPQLPAQPSTGAERDLIVMPVTFADGVTVELVYPPELALERLEATSEVILTAETGGRDVPRDVRLARAGELPRPEGLEGTDYLLLSFGNWEARVSAATEHGAPPLSSAERRAFMEDLAVEQAETGFPVVVNGPRLRIARNPDEDVAPVMLLLDAGDLDPGLALTRPDSCAAAALEENWRCDEAASIVIAPYGEPAFQDAVLRQVEVRAVPAP